MQTDHDDLTRLSDRELLERLAQLDGKGRRLLADLLAHLGEVDRRRLYLVEAKGNANAGEHAPEHVRTETPEQSSGATPDASAASRAAGQERVSDAASPARPRSRYILRSIRREVAERDGGQCTYLSPDGYRCRERSFLELHHLTPFARGGPSTTAGLTLRCRAHNQHQAVLDFGAEHVRRQVRKRREMAHSVRT